MAGRTMAAPKGQRAWTRIVIFISLYFMLLLSLAQCALVIQLYAVKRADSTMTPSLILGLIASFFSIPFVFLHTLLAWHYKKSPGASIPRTPIHTACSHLPRLMVVLWLATTVAGLVVVSRQPTCNPSRHTESFWRIGDSCVLHRVAVIFAVLSLITACALFCSIELCLRPYDASLLGLYAPQRPPRDGSIFSESSWESDTLKHEILYLCRHPDAGPGNGELYWSNNNSSIFEQPVRPPSIRYPAPVRPRPQLRLNTDPGSIRPEIVRESIISPDDTSPKGSSTGRAPGNETPGSAVSGIFPISRTSTEMTTHPNDSVVTVPATIAELPGVPEIPAIPTKYKHTRQKSSVSSRKKFLPKAWPLISMPLSADPQIRALSSPDLSRQAESDSHSDIDTSKVVVSPPAPVAAPMIYSSPIPITSQSPTPESNLSGGPAIPRLRAMSASPGNPPSVLPPQPLAVRKSRTSYIAQTPRSIHHPHHPNYVPPRPNQPSHGPPQGQGHGRPVVLEADRPRRQNTRRISNNYQFERSQIPRHTQSHRYHYQQEPPRRYHSHNHHHHHHHQLRTPLFDPSRALPPIPRSDDVEIVYPSTRRPRSSTYGGVGLTRDHIGNIKAGARSSVNLTSGMVTTEDGRRIDNNTYRGAQRTSMHGF